MMVLCAQALRTHSWLYIKLRKLCKKCIKCDFAHPKYGTFGAQTEKPKTLFNRNVPPKPYIPNLIINVWSLKSVFWPLQVINATF